MGQVDLELENYIKNKADDDEQADMQIKIEVSQN